MHQVFGWPAPANSESGMPACPEQGLFPNLSRFRAERESSSHLPSPSPSDDADLEEQRPAGHIPRPRNAFIIFRCEVFDKSSLGNKKDPRGEVIGKRASKAWKLLSQKEMKVYVEKAKKEKLEHARRFPDYKYRPKKRYSSTPTRSSARASCQRRRTTTQRSPTPVLTPTSDGGNPCSMTCGSPDSDHILEKLPHRSLSTPATPQVLEMQHSNPSRVEAKRSRSSGSSLERPSQPMAFTSFAVHGELGDQRIFSPSYQITPTAPLPSKYFSNLSPATAVAQSSLTGWDGSGMMLPLIPAHAHSAVLTPQNIAPQPSSPIDDSYGQGGYQLDWTTTLGTSQTYSDMNTSSPPPFYPTYHNNYHYNYSETEATALEDYRLGYLNTVPVTEFQGIPELFYNLVGDGNTSQ